MIKENDVFGIYIVEKVLNEKNNYGKRLYIIRCTVCGKKFKKTPNCFASKSGIVNNCKHLSKNEIRVSQLSQWSNEDHFCETCGNKITTKYGSGRFCSKYCSHVRIQTEQTKEKTRRAIIGNKCFKNELNGEIRYFKMSDKIPEHFKRYAKKYCKYNIIRQQLSKSIKYKFKKINTIRRLSKQCLLCGKKLNKHNKTGYCFDCFVYSDECYTLRSNNGKKGYQSQLKHGTHHGWASRKIQSYPEKFWNNVLMNNHIEFQGPNKPLKKPDGNGCYFLDFYIEKNGYRVDLEIDGKQHKYTDRIKSDQIRDKYISSLNYIVYRVEWNSINTDVGKSLMSEKISNFLDFYNSL